MSHEGGAIMRDVVLVHGCPGNGAGWEPLARCLSAEARVTALDLRDVGRDEPRRRSTT